MWAVELLYRGYMSQTYLKGGDLGSADVIIFFSNLSKNDRFLWRSMHKIKLKIGQNQKWSVKKLSIIIYLVRVCYVSSSVEARMNMFN